MAVVIPSIGLKGIEGYQVQVEVQLVLGIEGMSIVGLPDASVKESKDRVLATLYAYGCEIPDKKIIVNLLPAEQRKNSPLFDLAIAIAVMKAGGFIHHAIPKDAAFLGGLSLDGRVNAIEGMLPAILAAKKERFKILYLPHLTDIPLGHIDRIELRFIHSLQDAIDSFSGQLTVFSPPPTDVPHMIINEDHIPTNKDFKYILGHKKVKRALEIAAAGGHNVLMSGPPGCGKSLLAETFPSILPTLNQDQQFELMSIYQLARVQNPSFQTSPFRAPHHSSSAVALIGGGSNPKPGEVSLAHHGVLFLDEMAEFPKRALDMLRQPIETGKVTISRAMSTVTYPSQFILLGAMNPCPCGFLGSNDRYCTCTSKQIVAYQNRISGPILDRMDILLSLTTVSLDNEKIETNETSEVMRQRVKQARIRQQHRYQTDELNANVSQSKLLDHRVLTPEQQRMFQQWSSDAHWSTRVQVKILRLARTISDLNGDDAITNESLMEASTLRRFDLTKNLRESGATHG